MEVRGLLDFLKGFALRKVEFHGFDEGLFLLEDCLLENGLKGVFFLLLFSLLSLHYPPVLQLLEGQIGGSVIFILQGGLVVCWILRPKGAVQSGRKPQEKGLFFLQLGLCEWHFRGIPLILLLFEPGLNSQCLRHGAGRNQLEREVAFQFSRWLMESFLYNQGGGIE